MTFKTDLYTHLAGDTSITDLVSTRIRFGQAKQNEPLPWLRLTIASEETATQLDGPADKTRPRVQIDAIAENAGAADALADVVRTRMWGMVGTHTNVNVRGVVHDNTVDFEEPKNDGSDNAVFMVRQDFLVWHSQTTP